MDQLGLERDISLIVHIGTTRGIHERHSPIPAGIHPLKPRPQSLVIIFWIDFEKKKERKKERKKEKESINQSNELNADFVSIDLLNYSWKWSCDSGRNSSALVSIQCISDA